MPAPAHRALPGWPAGLVFAVLTADVIGNGPMTRREQNAVRRGGGVGAPWSLVTSLGDRPALAAMTAIASVAAVARRGSGSPVAPVATVATGTTVRWALSRAIRRDRPAPERWLMGVDGPSYPSRHATAATLGALVLYRSLPSSVLLSTILATGVAAVGLSRIRLGVHWPSDVLAGVALATLVDAVISSATSWPGRPRVSVAR